MAENQTPAVVLLSGGADSTVLLHHVLRNLGRRPVHALSFNYSQRHSKELDCARWQARAAGVTEHRIIDVSFLGDLLKPATALVTGGKEVPSLRDLPAAQRVQPPTYVPNRNMILLSVGAAYAETAGVEEVFYGAQAQDQYGYWDCTTTFVERLNHVLALNRGKPVKVYAPFVRMKKAETIQLGMELGVDFSRTWSCYKGGQKACGTCPTCAERLAAFRAAGAQDPIPYETEPNTP
ncbi:MAG: 7-cyano-7-deazaguanine synthase QueC [Candidatus Hydrogenedentes bacterium]|nr:7-cyano-7-deazaguanine synthase QueC [Candidatus Hydrogenedentota bacterium]